MKFEDIGNSTKDFSFHPISKKIETECETKFGSDSKNQA